jgi:hypothetical protein
VKINVHDKDGELLVIVYMDGICVADTTSYPCWALYPCGALWHTLLIRLMIEQERHGNDQREIEALIVQVFFTLAVCQGTTSADIFYREVREER